MKRCLITPKQAQIYQQCPQQHSTSVTIWPQLQRPNILTFIPSLLYQFFHIENFIFLQFGRSSVQKIRSHCIVKQKLTCQAKAIQQSQSIKCYKEMNKYNQKLGLGFDSQSDKRLKLKPLTTHKIITQVKVDHKPAPQAPMNDDQDIKKSCVISKKNKLIGKLKPKAKESKTSRKGQEIREIKEERQQAMQKVKNKKKLKPKISNQQKPSNRGLKDYCDQQAC